MPMFELQKDLGPFIEILKTAGTGIKDRQRRLLFAKPRVIKCHKETDTPQTGGIPRLRVCF